MDCMQYMKTIPDKWFDLAIVDPPYGIGQPKQGNLKGYKGRDSLEIRLQKNRISYGRGKLINRSIQAMNSDWDFFTPEKEYFDELFRISINQIIWGGNYFALQPNRCFICWDKVQPWENFSSCEYAWTSFDFPSSLFRYDNRTGLKIHPTQKPIKLYGWLLEKYAKKGDRIFDSHLGSGSSRIAAYKLGFDFYATEIDKYYFEAQEERFRKECFGEITLGNGQKVVQKSLFND